VGNITIKTIIDRKIEQFVLTFDEDGSSMYKNDDGRLYHPGEYGSYRERCLINLIRFVLPRNISISDGFIINSDEERGTQCDVIIYEENIAPFIDDGITNFFPIEIVKSFGEVKSSLSKADLKDALIKLANNKMLFKNSNTPFTFLVCKSIERSAWLDPNELIKMYGSIERKYWHNLILSIDDGIFTYYIDLTNCDPDIRDSFKQVGYNVGTGGDPQHPYPLLQGGMGSLLGTETPIGGLAGKDAYAYTRLFLAHIAKEVPKHVARGFDIAKYLDLCGN
jgi:hypothetical protein